MRHLRLLLVVVAAAPLACEVYAQPPAYSARVQVQAPPPATVEVGTQPPPDPNDPNAQAQVDPNAQPTDQDSTDADPSAIDDFRNVLAPYGAWVDDPQYGTIWFPSPSAVGGDFTPYLTSGHWVYDNDYTWVSDYDWGWAPFHYGRWFVYPGHGWAWIPGKEYAGAWVTWRNGDDGYGYVGWAPTPPNWYYRGGQVVTVQSPWYEPNYTYATTGDLFAPVIRDRIIRDPGRVRLIAGRTRVYDAPRGGYVNGAGGIRMRVRGPAPMRLGLNATTLPRVAPNARSVVRAQEYMRTRPVRAPQGRTVTPGHPPIDRNNIRGPENNRGNIEQARPGVRGPENNRGNIEQARPGVRGPEPQARPANERVVPSNQRVETRPESRPEANPGVRRGVAPTPSATTTNLRKPYPPPSVTHRR